MLITTDVDEALLLADRLLVTTDRPARVRAEFRIDLSRPRRRADLLHGDRLQRIKDRALDLLQTPDAARASSGT